jgi:hypothetical protein
VAQARRDLGNIRFRMTAIVRRVVSRFPGARIRRFAVGSAPPPFLKNILSLNKHFFSWASIRRA